jgi:hypothetical protein
VTFENLKTWAFFQPQRLRLGLNRRLAYLADQNKLKDILRHEMCHYLAWIRYRDQIADHGPEFRSICREFGWDHNVSSASMLEDEFIGAETGLKHEAMVNKVKKLLSLATSSNQSEATLAASKANELILKYNLQWIANDRLQSQGAEPITYAAVALEGNRITAKERAIGDMLSVYLVETIFSTGRGYFALEVIGEQCNIMLAVHAAQFLNLHMEQLLQQERRLHSSMNGIQARNSFFQGVAQGFCQRHKKTQTDISMQHPEYQQALILIGNELKQHFQRAYPKTRLTRYYAGTDHNALNRGSQAGRNLNIKSAVTNNSERFLLK